MVHYITVKQLAERLSVSKQWVWTQAKNNSAFPQPIKLSSGCTRFSIKQIESYEKKCGELSQRASRSGRS